MSRLLLACLLAAPGSAQETPSASTDTVSASTAAVAESSGAPVAAPTLAPAPEKPSLPRNRVVVHKAAADWEPVSVRLRPASGGRNAFEALVHKADGKRRGRPSTVKAAARVHPSGEDRWLVVSVYPVSLRPQRLHLEARFLVQEGYLEAVQLAAVRIVGEGWRPADEQEDSFSLRARGVDFNEQQPGSAQVDLAAIDPGPGAHAFNSGRVRRAAFGGRELGDVDFSWSLSGVTRR